MVSVSPPRGRIQTARARRATALQEALFLSAQHRTSQPDHVQVVFRFDGTFESARFLEHFAPRIWVPIHEHQDEP